MTYYWAVSLPGLAAEQAEVIVDFSRDQLWPNVFAPHVLDPRHANFMSWDYSTTVMMLNIIREAYAKGELSVSERSTCENFIEEFEDWLQQAEHIAPEDW